MSTNRDLLIKIWKNLDKDPLFVKELPVEAIINCVCYELHEIKQLYAPDHYSNIQDKIINYAGPLQEAVYAGDSKKASSVIKDILDLHDMMPDIDIALPFLETANYDRILNRHIMEGTVIAMGDSHSCFFSGQTNLSLIPVKNDISTCSQVNDYLFTILHLGPCLAFNSDRYGSQNRVREKIEWLDENFLLQNDTIIISLGEIDVRTQVYKHVKAGDGTYKDIVDDILSHYLNTLLWLKNKGYRVICYGPIGSLKDDAPLDDYRPREGLEVERNLAGRYYNEKLEHICNEHGLEFFTLFYDMVNEDNYTNKQFLSDDEFHLGQYGYQIALDKLRNMGVNIE